MKVHYSIRENCRLIRSVKGYEIRSTKGDKNVPELIFKKSFMKITKCSILSSSKYFPWEAIYYPTVVFVTANTLRTHMLECYWTLSSSAYSTWKAIQLFPSLFPLSEESREHIT